MLARLAPQPFRSAGPAAPRAGGWLARARGLLSAGRPGTGAEVTAVMLGTRCHLARVAARPGGRLRLVDADEGDPAMLRRWRQDGRLPRRGAVLVLQGRDRHWLVLERPPVADAELALAARFPLAEAMEAEPDALLTTTLQMPVISDGAREQVLAVGARLEAARAQLQQLADAGVRVRSIDILDSALRGMVLLQDPDADGWIVPAIIGNRLCIGLVWRGQLGALRNLALPERAPRDEAEFREQLALHIQRTADHFERQATRLAVRQVLVALTGAAADAHDEVCAALPYPSRRFDPAASLDADDTLLQRLQAHAELVPLACLAAARLIDARGPAAVAATAPA